MKQQGNNSYWLPDGRIIFAYKYNDSDVAPSWRIGVRQKRGKRNTISSFEMISNRYYTEKEAKADLNRYAEQEGLKPAY